MWSLLAISTASVRSLFFADSSCNSNDHTSTVTRTRWWVAIIHGDEERRPFLCFWVQSTLFSFFFLRSKSDFYSYWTDVFFVSTSLSFVFPIFVCLLQSWQSLKKIQKCWEKNTVWMHIRFRVNWSSVMKKKAFRPDFFSNIHAEYSCFLDHAFHEEHKEVQDHVPQTGHIARSDR